MREHAMGLGTVLLMGLWFGLAAGLVEGVGLLAFQRLNWVSWGPMLHVSAPILWISPIVDAIVFTVLACLPFAAGRLIPKISPFQAIVFILALATFYDWLTVTGRLYHKSSLLLALGLAVVFSRWTTKHRSRVTSFVKVTSVLLSIFVFAAWVGTQGLQGWREQRHVAELPKANPASPNVIVIVVDTLRADHLSSYGYKRPTSPTMDRLAAEGTLFENSISTSSWSLPSHASLVTGRSVHEHGADNVRPLHLFGPNENKLNNLPVIGEALQKLGYRTGAFSANRTWFSHDLGFGRGFIHFEDYFHSPADMLVRTLYGREFARIYLSRTEHSKPKRFLRWIGWNSLLDQDEEGSGSRGGALGVRKRAPVVNSELEHWIAEDTGHPFFAFLNYFDVHRHYGGPPDYPKPAWSQEDQIDRYDDSIRYVDDSINNLMAELKKHHLDRNTLLIITSDHGESLGEHGLEAHGNTLYWNLIHVPLIVWWPGHVPSSVRVADPISNSVIPASILELLGQSSVTPFDSPTLKSYWSKSNTSTSAVLSELSVSPYAGEKNHPPDPVPTALSAPMTAVVSGEWHLIAHEKYGNQLYDWTQDPGETRDLGSTSTGQAQIPELASKLRSLLGNSAPSPRSLAGH